MKKQFLTLATALFVAGAMFTSCANDPEEAPVQPDETQITTRHSATSLRLYRFM